MNREDKYYLYWIYRSCHTNLFNEGYIGITNNPTKRWGEHRRLAKTKQYHIHHALNKYKDIKFQVLCCGNFKDILDLESKLRPIDNIGWNTCPGGNFPSKTAFSDEANLKKAEQTISLGRIEVLNLWCDYYEKGLSVWDLVHKYNIHVSTVWRFIRGEHKAYPDLKSAHEVFKNNIKYIKGRPNSINESLYDQILTDRENGSVIKEISKKYGLPEWTVNDVVLGKYKYLKEYSCFRIIYFKNSNNPNIKKYTYEGVSLSSKDWGKRLGVTRKAFENRIKRGWSEERLFTEKKENNRLYVLVDDQRKSLSELAKQYNINYDTLHDRVYRQKLSIGEALKR
jgi:Mor family transcriptional regulator